MDKKMPQTLVTSEANEIQQSVYHVLVTLRLMTVEFLSRCHDNPLRWVHRHR